MTMLMWFLLAVLYLEVIMLMGLLGRVLGRKAALKHWKRQVDHDADEAMDILRRAGYLDRE